ncbi:MAG TPA: sigma factor-like helix-turn-helix DNA-binding protein [Nocardioides sp.]|nr:sigma factor-like helix-turn-helix DNA-binding protein [Nocardioides sp.]
MTTTIDWVQEIDASFDGYDVEHVEHDAIRRHATRWRSGRDVPAAGLADYLDDRHQHVRRVAHAICCDWARAEDAVRRTVADLGSAWPHLADAAEADAFVHRALARLDVQDSPSPRSWREDRADDFPVEDQSLIFDGLQSLPAVQRKVLVLHDWVDLPAEEVAAALDIDITTVHRHAARGRAALALLMPEPA